MDNAVFVEAGDFFAWCWAEERDDGWQPVVTFERKADHHARQPLIPAMKHSLGVRLTDRDAAMQAAIAHADSVGQSGDAGL